MKSIARESRYFFTAAVFGLLLLPVLLWAIDGLLGLATPGDLRQLLSGYQKFYGALDEPVTWLWVLSPYFLFLLMRQLFNRMRPEGGTAIGKVAATGKVSLPESLVEAGGDINTANATGQTPLHLAAASGNVETVRMLLDEGAELDLPDTVEGFSALHVATMHGHADVVDLLVRYGADPEARTRRQQTPLHLAALHGHAGVTARLLKYHVRLDSLDAEGMTAHQLAEKYGRNDVAGLISDYAENIWPYLQISNG